MTERERQQNESLVNGSRRAADATAAVYRKKTHAVRDKTPLFKNTPVNPPSTPRFKRGVLIEWPSRILRSDCLSAVRTRTAVFLLLDFRLQKLRSLPFRWRSVAVPWVTSGTSGTRVHRVTVAVPRYLGGRVPLVPL